MDQHLRPRFRWCPRPQTHRYGHRHPRRPATGFTLVEVLVALLIMAVLAALAWRGLDGIVRARDGSNAAMDRALRLNTIVTQWEQDLQAVQDSGAVPPLKFDGQSLRLTRRAEGGIVLVVWAVRGGVWQRWAAPVATRSNELNDYWLRSQQLLGNEAGQLTVAKATDWQLYSYRGNAWTNAQSTGDLIQQRVELVPPPAPPASAGSAAGGGTGSSGGGGAQGNQPPPTPVLQEQREQLPDAVRLVITLETGTLTRDIALGPGGS